MCHNFKRALVNLQYIFDCSIRVFYCTITALFESFDHVSGKVLKGSMILTKKHHTVESILYVDMIAILHKAFSIGRPHSHFPFLSHSRFLRILLTLVSQLTSDTG